MSARTTDSRKPHTARSDRPGYRGALRAMLAAAALCPCVSSASAQITQIIDETGDGMGNVLRCPRGMAVDAGGNVYVTSHGYDGDTYFDNSVFKITPGGVISQIMDETGDGMGNMIAGPSRVIANNDDIYVAGLGSDNVFKITPGGVVTQIIGPEGDGMGNVLSSPENLAIDANGNIIVGGRYSHNVFRIAPGGGIAEIIGPDGDGNGNTLLVTHDIAVDASGNVFVVGYNSDNVFRITATGVITEIVDQSAWFGGQEPQLLGPTDLAVDTNGNVFVSGYISSNVFKITPGGVITEIIDLDGDSSGNFLQSPSPPMVDSGGNVFVFDDKTDDLFKITPGDVISVIMDSAGDGCDSYSAKRISAIDANDNLFLGSGYDRVFKIDPAGKKFQIITDQGDEMGNTLGGMVDLIVDGNGTVFVAACDSRNVFKIESGDYVCVPEGPYFEEMWWPWFPWSPFFPDCTGGQLYSRVNPVEYPVQDFDLEMLGIDPETIDFSFGTRIVPIWEIHFDGELLAPAQLTFNYQGAPPLVDPEHLAIFHFDGATATWEELPQLEFVPFEWIMVEAQSFSPFVLGISRSVLDCADAIDTDGDGVPDDCPSEVPGDLTGDGLVNVQDLLSLLAVWGRCPAPCPPSCSGDLNGDCRVDTVDLLQMLANWS